MSRVTILLSPHRSVDTSRCHTTMSIPPSGFITPPPLLDAFKELFTSRLNIDKFCVNLHEIKDYFRNGAGYMSRWYILIPPPPECEIIMVCERQKGKF